ncbi:DUF1493 family protein [Ectopseudomonas alcaliphila]|uniref:DUF1493 family protein n=1 Tax=Ectopseudomonas alcaliphila TaxID=101564 RepID=UPI0027879B90|nr:MULTISPECIES: DUF1493 family protein [Pseudomonas]MDP9939037.1 hypothetical protein [Pseudomonas sp. 3400]MDR7011260.1 hypothetical protein [Pseudomonas alcaliphila]
MPSQSEFLEAIQQHTISKADVSLTSRLIEDLRIDGDDAEELIEALNARAHPDCPDVEWHRHFHAEGELLSWSHSLKWLAYHVGLVKHPPLRLVESLTVEELMTLYGLSQEMS